MSVIQAVIIIFGLFAIVRTIKQFRSGHITFVWLAVWLAFWILVGTVTMLPQTTQWLASIAGVGRGVDLVIYLSIIGLFYFMFKLFVKLEDIEREITTLVRKLALDDVKQETEKENEAKRNESAEKSGNI